MLIKEIIKESKEHTSMLFLGAIIGIIPVFFFNEILYQTAEIFA